MVCDAAPQCARLPGFSHKVLLPAGPEATHCALRIHNDEHRSPVHLGKAFGHFSCSHPSLRIAKLIEDMQLTGETHMHCTALPLAPTTCGAKLCPLPVPPASKQSQI